MTLHSGRFCAAVGLAFLLAATAGAGEVMSFAGQSPNERLVFVPWKVLNSASDAVAGDYIVYWVPASAEELRHSPLLRSRTLAAYAGRCVGMQVVRPDDEATFERLGGGRAPAVVLTDAAGSVLSHVDATSGGFSIPAAERMVHDALSIRQQELDRLLNDARARSEAHERDEAIEIYRRVAAQRCFAPRQAREAERSLRKLRAQ